MPLPKNFSVEEKPWRDKLMLFKCIVYFKSLLKRENSEERKGCTIECNIRKPRNPASPEWILPSFWHLVGSTFQLNWINLQWEHIKIAAGPRNRLLIHPAIGLFHYFSECFTLSKASSQSNERQCDSDWSVTLTQRHKSQVWQDTTIILLHRRLENKLIFFVYIFQQPRRWSYFWLGGLFWLFRWLKLCGWVVVSLTAGL